MQLPLCSVDTRKPRALNFADPEGIQEHPWRVLVSTQQSGFGEHLGHLCFDGFAGTKDMNTIIANALLLF